MDFKRKRIRGISQKSRRVWMAPGGYRIVWRREAYGIQLPARFQACVRVMVPTCSEKGYIEMWDFVNSRKHLYKTKNAAITDCEKHQALWSKVAECSGIRAVCLLFSKFPLGVPKSLRAKLNKRVFYILMRSEAGRKKDLYEDDNDEIDGTADEKVAEEVAAATPGSESPVYPVENVGAEQGTASNNEGKNRRSPGTRTEKTARKSSGKSARRSARKSARKSSAKPVSKRSPGAQSDNTGVVATDSVKKRKPRSDKGQKRAAPTTTPGDTNGG